MFHMTFFCSFFLAIWHSSTLCICKRARALKHTQIHAHMHKARDILKYRCQAVQFICFVVELSCWYMKAEATIVKPFNILYVLTKAYAELMGFIFCSAEPAIASYIRAILYAFACVRLCVCAKFTWTMANLWGYFLWSFPLACFFAVGSLWSRKKNIVTIKSDYS